MREKTEQTLPLDMKRLSFIDKLCVGSATLCGVGYVPLMPGTAASILAIIVFFAVKDQFAYALFTGSAIILSFLVCARAEKAYDQKDCKRIVIDDFCGMCLALVFLPRQLMLVIIGFWLFRGFDMLKIYPADKIERLPGSWGIVGDDLTAGIYACAILQFLRFSFQITS